MVTRWFYDLDPVFGDFNRLRDELDKMFDIGLPLSNIRSVPRGTFPPINLQEVKNSVFVDAYLPGVDPKNVEVVFHDNTLTIKGERDTSCLPEKEIQPGNYHRRERYFGAFSRIVSLPEGLDSDKVKAQYKDGVLKITIGKMEEKKPKQISVKVD